MAAVLPLFSASCSRKEKAYLPLRYGSRYIYAATITDDDGKRQRLPAMIPQGRGFIEVSRAPASMEFDAVLHCSFSGRRTSLWVAEDEKRLKVKDEEGRTIEIPLPPAAGESYELSASPYYLEVGGAVEHPTEDWGKRLSDVLLLKTAGAEEPVLRLILTPQLGFTRIEFLSSFYGVSKIEYDLVEIKD